MNEKEKKDKLSQGFGGSGSDFFSDSDTAPGTVTVSAGPYQESLPVQGMTVGEVRKEFSERLDIDPKSTAVLDGNDCDESVVVATGMTLTFINRAGEKGRK